MGPLFRVGEQNGRVAPDLDDTVSGRARPEVVKPAHPDVEDTLFSRLRGGAAPVPAPAEEVGDDTVLKAPGESTAPRSAQPDVDDTVVRGSVVPPPLVEPPAPEARPLPVVDALADILSGRDGGDPAAGPAVLRALLADGTEVPLDGPVYVGRKPSPPRIHTGPAPRLVTLPSPGRELSATHLELKPVGGTLVASDMRSTNGTVVRLPGSPPRTLLRGESAVVVAGTRIDLGDGAVLDILAPVGEPA